MKVDKIIAEITDKISKNANVKAVFGEPYTKDKMTIIPVTKVLVRGLSCGCGDEEDP